MDLGEKSQRIPKWVAVAPFIEKYAQVHELSCKRICVTKIIVWHFVVTKTSLGFILLLQYISYIIVILYNHLPSTQKDIDNDIDEVLQEFEETKKRKLMHTVVFY